MEWRKINGFEKYSVSDTGLVRNDKTGQMLAQYFIGKNSGYKRVKFANNKHYLVHRLVALAFVPNPENKAEVNHINGDKTDNKADNLEWVTREENMQHRCKVLGKKVNPVVATQVAARVNSKPVICLETGKRYASVSEASKDVHIHSSGISNCCNHKPRYITAGGYHWEYADK